MAGYIHDSVPVKIFKTVWGKMVKSVTRVTNQGCNQQGKEWLQNLIMFPVLQ